MMATGSLSLDLFFAPEHVIRAFFTNRYLEIEMKTPCFIDCLDVTRGNLDGVIYTRVRVVFFKFVDNLCWV
jgi:hypothetical protein